MGFEHHFSQLKKLPNHCLSTIFYILCRVRWEVTHLFYNELKCNSLSQSADYSSVMKTPVQLLFILFLALSAVSADTQSSFAASCKWEAMESETALALRAIWGISLTEVYAAGDD
jgi:hypothetical protein